jgi:hypothetical protein
MSIIYLDKFNPRPYQIPLCKALEEQGYKRLVAIWPRRCLSGKTHITMADGSFKLLNELKIGDKILSWDGTKFIEDTIKHIWSTGIKPTKIISSPCFVPLIASENHQFANTTCTGTIVHWDELGSIRKYRRILQYSGIKHGNVENINLAYFWGYMLADGYVSGYQQPKFTNTNKEILDHVDYLAQALFHVTVIWRKKGNAYDLGFSNGTRGGGETENPIKELFQAERVAIQKWKRRLPKSIWEFNEQSVLAFFAALISADGNIYSHKEGFVAKDTKHVVPAAAEITLSCGLNDNYAWDIYWLLRKISIMPQIPYKEKTSNWKIKIAKHDSVKKLLTYKVYGKEEVQRKALNLCCQKTKVREIFNGCYRGGFTIENGADEELFDIETNINHNFIANGYVVHNSGKDVCAFNLMIRAALRRIGVYYYIFPTYSQARKVIWDSITIEGERFLNYIPKELIVNTNTTEMKINLINGSLIQLIGSDHIDALVGTNPIGIVFSEYALQDPRAYQFLRPILLANDGWAMFISTPRGKSHLWELYNVTLKSSEWFCSKLSVEDTKHIPLESIQKEIDEGLISEDLVQQEYFCSFEMGVEGAYYTKYIDKMRLKGQIGQVPYEPNFKVNTAWDLGVRDSTCIIFFQMIGQTIRIIDYYEKNKEGLEHYVQVLAQKGYVYGKHIAPHDIRVREFGSGMTRWEKARQLGITFTIAPDVSIVDGIEAVRSTLGKVWLDEFLAAKLIKALENYRQEYDPKKRIYKPFPLHNEFSHGSDAMRMLCVSLPKIREGSSPEALEKRYKEAMYGDDLPGFFNSSNNH